MKLKEIIVSEECFHSKDEYDIIGSNIYFLNSLFDEYVSSTEASEEALKSYYVDFYLAQVNNGGFSQLVFNARSNLVEVMNYISAGLHSMQAKKNLVIFDQSASIIRNLGEKRIEAYLESQYWGNNEERDILNTFDDEFYALQDIEDLISFNAKWLRSHSQLIILNDDAFNQKIHSIAKSIPDREARLQTALKAEPRYMKIIRALAAKAGQDFNFATASGSCKYKGEDLCCEYFRTKLGLYYMVEYEGEAFMFDGSSDEFVVSMMISGTLVS